MDLHKLKAFIVVAEELNFRKSAEILNMSSPPLTRLISSLEKDLKVKLFERTTRKVYLTPAGTLLLAGAREIVAAFERVETGVRAVGATKNYSIKIGFSKTAFMSRFPSIIEEFQNRFPKIKLDLLEETSHKIISLLNDWRIDLVFSEVFFQSDNLVTYQVSSENVGVLLPYKHPLAKRKSILFHELEHETIIIHSNQEASEFLGRTSHLRKEKLLKSKIYIRNKNESCPILVATGKGISFQINGSCSVIPECLRWIRVKDLSTPIFMIWKSEDDSPQLKTFINLVKTTQSIRSENAQCLGS